MLIITHHLINLTRINKIKYSINIFYIIHFNKNLLNSLPDLTTLTQVIN